MQLNSVVLPAPLGPISPMISPGSMASEISRLASRPPKRLVDASTRSSDAMRSGRRRAAAPEPARPRQRQQAGGAEGGDDHDDEAVHDQVDAAAGQRTGAEHGRHDLRDRNEDDGAQHR